MSSRSAPGELSPSAARWFEYIERKVDLSRRLGRGELGGEYSDAVLLLGARISGMAAERWPGRRLDQRRMVEAMVRLGDPRLHTSWISTPLLIERLLEQGRREEVARLIAQLPSGHGSALDTRVLQGSEVDVGDNVITVLELGLSQREVRAWSYASLFYVEFRSALVHEARLGDSADDVPHSSAATADVSYTNVLEGRPPRARRKLHFSVEWVAQLTLSIARRVAAEDFPELPRPEVWWLDGGV